MTQAATNSIEPIAASARLSLRWRLGLLAIALVLLAFDQFTKHLAITHLQYGQSVSVFEPWLDWTLVHNFGAAFSFLNNTGGLQHWFFSSIAIAAGIGLPIWLHRLTPSERLLSVALCCIWSGAIGNLIDRLRFRYVIDFVHVHWKDDWHYPVFNVADSAITIGAVLIISHEFMLWRRTRQANLTSKSV